MKDPTVDGDAVGYLLQQASLSHQNGAEEDLSEQCAEYLRHVIAEHKEMREALRKLVNTDCYAGNDICRAQDDARHLVDDA